MRRLFSTFARGLPGVGLLLLRTVSGIALISHGLAVLLVGPSAGLFILNSLEICAGLLLLAGLWTPIAGVLTAAMELCTAYTQVGDLWIGILLGTIGAALVLLGPGAWSVDARLFGWKRINIPTRKS